MDKQKFIPLMVPDIQEQDIDSVTEVLRSGMLIQGSQVQQLENNIANFLGVENVIAVANGTASLHLALIALGIGQGDEVIVPAFSYIATANVVELVGATPIFVDININSFNIDYNSIEKAITKRTKAIIPVHEFGLSCDIEKIVTLASKYNIAVIEDAACALGAKENNKYVGTFGNVASFSFHPRKAITSGEGGILITNDKDLARKLRILRNHGIEVTNGKMEFVEAGYNYRLTDFQAALVNSQFKRIENILAYKNKLAKIYLNSLKNYDTIKLPTIENNKIHTWQSFHIILEGNRDQMIYDLKLHNIGSNYGAQCMPFQKFYQEKYKLNCQKLFPNSMLAFTQGLVLPLYERLSESEILIISNVLIELTNNNAKMAFN